MITVLDLFIDLNSYLQAHHLTYPINLLRNVARMNADTFYVLASDAELYPRANLVHLFLQMMKRRSLRKDKIVFVLPVFEIMKNQTVPSTKTQLVN